MTDAKNGWTGGQYSVFRAAFGAYLTVHLVDLIPYAREVFSGEGVLPRDASPLVRLFPNIFLLSDAPWVVTAVLAVGAVASVFFALGKWDRWAALVVWYVWACLFGRNPLIANPGLPYVGWMLLAHATLPAAPYGSWDRRGITDPGHRWRMPDALWAAAWAVMALGYTYSGYTKLVSPSWVDGSAFSYLLESPLARPNAVRAVLLHLPDWVCRVLTWATLGLELFYAPLALLRRVRPWLWASMLAMHLCLIGLIDFADLSLGMVMLHLFTFDPRWVNGRAPGTRDLLFYDGSCGLCHRAVRFFLAEDRTGAIAQFAPLGGDTFLATLPETDRASLPDSLVVRTGDGRVLVRSDAVLWLMSRLGGAWRVFGQIGLWIPRAIRDGAYDGIARVRKRLFPKPDGACPLLPPDLRARFAG